MRAAGKYVRLLGTNFKALIWFELLYKFALLAIGVPVLKQLVNSLIWITGYRYLTAENIRRFVLHPLTILFALALLVFLVFYELVEVFAIIYLTDQSMQGKHTHSGCAFGFARKQALKLRHPKNFAMLIVVMLMIPVMNVGVMSALLSLTAVPQMVLSRINSSVRYIILFYGLIIVACLLMLRFIYTLHYSAIENYGLQAAGERSVRLSRRYHLRDFIQLLLLQLCIIAAFAVIGGGGIALIIFVQLHVAESGLFGVAASSVIAIFIGLVSAAFAALSFPVCYMLICGLYYVKKRRAGEKIRRAYEEEPFPDNRHRKLINILTAAVLAIAVVVSSLYLYGTSRGKYNLQIERIRTMSVTAHRGASAYYPENTMAAFVGAYEQGADWIELDVHQSEDGQVFIMHDNSFRRIAGLDKKAWELKWGEIRQLDAGRWFDPKFTGERFVLLEDVIEYAKQVGIRLNIEIKPAPEEEGLEESVADIVREAGFEQDCVITSQNYEALKTIKSYAPEMTTVYVMSLAAGRIEKLDAADHFSIEGTFVTRHLVARLHRQGKEIYAWTINSKKNINRMIDLGVDNIITDNIPLAKQCVNESKGSNLLIDYIYTVLDLLE